LSLTTIELILLLNMSQELNIFVLQMQSTLREHKDNVGGTYSKYNMLKVSIDTGLTFVRMYLTVSNLTKFTFHVILYDFIKCYYIIKLMVFLKFSSSILQKKSKNEIIFQRTKLCSTC
jgi:hypothetical protein